LTRLLPFGCAAAMALVPLVLAQAPATDAPPAAPAAPAADAAAPSPADEQFRFAVGFYRRAIEGSNRSYFEHAAREFERFAADFPKDARAAEALFQWGECHRLLAEQGAKAAAAHVPLAIEIYQRLRTAAPDHALSQDALVRIAAMLLQRGRHADVLTLLKDTDSGQLREDMAEAVLYHRGMASLQAGQSEAALAQFAPLARKPLARAFPYRVYAKLHSAHLLRAAGKAEEARRELTALAAAEDVPASVREEAHFRLAEAAYVAGDYENAAAQYKTFLQRFPESGYAAMALINGGWALFQLGQHEAVLGQFRDAAAALGEHAHDARFLQASSKRALRQYERAIKDYRQVISEHPDQSVRLDAAFATVECLFRVGQYEACAAAAGAFVTNHPQHAAAADAYFFLAESYANLDQLDKASVAYENALRQHWNKWDYQEDALLVLAKLYVRMERPDRAAATARRIMTLKQSKRHVRALLLAAEYEVQAGNSEAALADYKRVIASYPDAAERPLALLSMADLQSRQGLIEPAVATVNQFLKEYADHRLLAKGLYLRGSFRFQLDQHELAIEDLQLCLQQPGFEDAEYAQLVLAYALWEHSQRAEAHDLEAEALKLFGGLLQSGKLSDDFAPQFLGVIGNRYIELNNLETAARCGALLRKHQAPEVSVAGLIIEGRVAFARGDFETARKRFYEARDRSAEMPEYRGVALSFLGESLRRLGRLDEALLTFKAGLEVRFRDADAKARAWLGLGRIYEERSNPEKALKHYRMVFFVYDHPRMAAEALLRTLHLEPDANTRQQLYRELQKRFPASLELFRQDTGNKELFGKLDAAAAE
jgi:tetratricopeptide (TPR) repeat protein